MVVVIVHFPKLNNSFSKPEARVVGVVHCPMLMKLFFQRQKTGITGDFVTGVAVDSHTINIHSNYLLPGTQYATIVVLMMAIHFLIL